MKIYRTIVIVLAIILGVYCTAFLVSSSTTQAAIKEPVTEEYYNLLKENSLKVAKTLNKSVLSDKTLKADFYFDGEELIVTVESKKAKVTAKIPISNQLLNVEEEILKLQGTVEFENIQYETQNKLEPAWIYIVIAIFAGVFAAVIVYAVFFEAWVQLKKHQKN